MEPGQYEHEAIWLGKACSDNLELAQQATDAIWKALEKMDKNSTDIKGELRTAVSNLSYLIGSEQRLKDYYNLSADQSTSEDIRFPTQKPKSSWIKRNLIGE